MLPPEKKVRISKEELLRMPPSLRIELFGHDPLKHEEPLFDKRTLIITLALIGLVIGGTLFYIEFIIRPEIKPVILTTQFELPATDGLKAHPELFNHVKEAWLDKEWTLFKSSADSLIRSLDSKTDIATVQALQLYKLRVHFLLGEWSEGESLARGLHARYPSDLPFQSDVYYYRGHMIAKKNSLEEAYTSFSESEALGGLYADESKRIMEKIERINRPLW